MAKKVPYTLQPTNDSLDCRCHSLEQVEEAEYDDLLAKRSLASFGSSELDNCSLRPEFGFFRDFSSFENLMILLEKVFQCAEVDIDDLDISLAEARLLQEIIGKKFLNGKKAEFPELNTPKAKLSTLQWINGVLATYKSTKRVEENNKFVYKYTIKNLKRRFNVKNGLRSTQTNEKLFYRFYFQSVSEDLKIPLDHFFDPLYKTLNRNPAFKSINNRYLALMFSSTQFKTDFFEFLKSEFKDVYTGISNKKLKKLFKQLKKEISEAETGFRSVNEAICGFAERLGRNHKCKLPWTYREVSTALSQFNSLVYYY